MSGEEKCKNALSAALCGVSVAEALAVHDALDQYLSNNDPDEIATSEHEEKYVDRERYAAAMSLQDRLDGAMVLLAEESPPGACPDLVGQGPEEAQVIVERLNRARASYEETLVALGMPRGQAHLASKAALRKNPQTLLRRFADMPKEDR